MRVLIVADRPAKRPLLDLPRRLAKGLARGGHDPLVFAYGEALAASWWRPKARADRALADLARASAPDLLVVNVYKGLDAATVERLREAAPRAACALLYTDMTAGVDPRVAAIARRSDWFISSGAGEHLARYRSAGAPRCAYLPNATDPDVDRPPDGAPRRRSQVLFTGKVRHGAPGQDPDRSRIVLRLLEMGLLSLYPGPAGPRLRDLDCLDAIAGARIVLSINAYNDVPLYHSDRLIHALGAGAFVLSKRVPRGDLLFEDGVHYRTFAGEEECVALVERCLADEEGCRRIALEGRRRAREAFHATRVAGYLVDLVERGRYDAPFCEVLGPG